MLSTLMITSFKGDFFMENSWNKEYFLQRINSLPDKNNYIFSDYEDIRNARSRFKVECKQCGYVWTVTVISFFYKNTRCTICKRGERWSLERFLKEIDNLPDRDNYIFSEYDTVNGYKSNFTVQCKKCGNIWKGRLDHFLKERRRCFSCNVGAKWNTERVKRDFALLNDCNDFTLLTDVSDDIKGANSKIRIKCHKCKHIWKVTIINFFHCGNRCPRCKASKGEKTIVLFLQKNKIKFESQKKFDTCKSKLQLPFDFYLPDYNTIIEFNGKQHYEIGTRSKSYEKNLREFEQIKIRDKIKKQWTTDNGYTFLEIRYDQINQIEEILTQELNL